MTSDNKVSTSGEKTLSSTKQMQIPTEYRPGYEKARQVNEELADRYVVHTMIGDPVMDNLLDELDGLDQVMVERMIRAGMDQNHDALKKALKRYAISSWILLHRIRLGTIRQHSIQAYAPSSGIHRTCWGHSSRAC